MWSTTLPPNLWCLWNKTCTWNFGVYALSLVEELGRSFKSPALLDAYLPQSRSYLNTWLFLCMWNNVSNTSCICELFNYYPFWHWQIFCCSPADYPALHFHLLALGLYSSRIMLLAFSRSFRWLILVSVQNSVPEVVRQSVSATTTHDFLYQELEVTARSLSHDSKLIFLVDTLQHLFPADSPSALHFSYSQLWRIFEKVTI